MKCSFCKTDLIILLFLAAIGNPNSLLARTSPADETGLPNILLIFIDDMGWPAVSCLGNEHVETRNIDRLAEEGMLFTSAYVTPQCTPSRASLMTGQHTARNRFWHVVGRYGYPYMNMQEPPYQENLSRDAYTLAEMMQDNGYVTALNGKWHLHTWNDRYPDPDGYYTYLFEKAKEYYGFDYVSIPEDMNYHQQGDKGVDYLTDEAIGFMKENREKPFFVFLSHHTIHGPVLAPESLVEKYREKGYPEEGVFNATYLAAIEHLDHATGRLLDFLDESGLDENTIVIFLTDNGGVDRDFSNEPLRYGKGSMYEGGIRVPMMVRWPGKIQAGSVNNTPVHIIDLYPTFLEIAGGMMDQEWVLDGESLVSLLSGRTDRLEREALYWYMPLYDASWGATPCAIVRRGDMKLIEFFGDYVDRENEWTYITGRRTELYDLSVDIGEKYDLSVSRPELTRRLQDELYRWIDSMDAPLPVLNPRYNPERIWERTSGSVLNFVPILENPIPDISFAPGTPFVFKLDPFTFREYDDEPLSYFICQEGGEQLPDWIDFNRETLEFSGLRNEPARLVLEVKAVDPQGAEAVDRFVLTLEPKLKVSSANPFYWEYKGAPLLLLGGSWQDNLFNHPEGLEEHLDLLLSVGGNYVRNTMSHRNEGNVFAYIREADGHFNLDRFNDEYWQRLENFLDLCYRRDIIVQIEIWDPWDHYEDHQSSGGWSYHPFNPGNNVNYTSGESGMPAKIDYAPRGEPTDHPFFRTVPSLSNNEPVLKYQHAYVDQLLSVTLSYPNVLYCVNNESGERIEWSNYWADYIHEASAKAGVKVHVTEMRRNEDVRADDHHHVYDHPGRYTFLDISQNNAWEGLGQRHYDNIMYVREYISDNPRPINNIKNYGAVRHGEDESVARFCRLVFAGCASARFHRPHPLEDPSAHEASSEFGLGLSPLAQQVIQSMRWVMDEIAFISTQPRNDLLSARQENEAYLLAEPGKQYALYFPKDGEVGLDLTSDDGQWEIRWRNVKDGTVRSGEPLTGGTFVSLIPPGPGHWAAVIKPAEKRY